MSRELELAKDVRDLLDKHVLPQVAKMSIDIGLLNKIAMLSEEIIKENESEHSE